MKLKTILTLLVFPIVCLSQNDPAKLALWYQSPAKLVGKPPGTAMHFTLAEICGILPLQRITSIYIATKLIYEKNIN